jgi:hypothetical protein
MWGYPFWLFLVLWLLLWFGPAIEAARLLRAALAGGLVTPLYAIAFIAQYAVLPFFDHRYRASLFPGDRLGAEISARFRAATGEPLAYVIGSMWLGGNVSRYSAERPRTLIDGSPARAVDRSRRPAAPRRRGDLERRRHQVPPDYARLAPDAEGAAADHPADALGQRRDDVRLGDREDAK